MIELHSFKKLSVRDQALITIAVLLDGREAANYFDAEDVRDQELKKVAIELAEISPELRMPLLGSLLRTALSEINAGQEGSR